MPRRMGVFAAAIDYPASCSLSARQHKACSRLTVGLIDGVACQLGSIFPGKFSSCPLQARSGSSTRDQVMGSVRSVHERPLL